MTLEPVSDEPVSGSGPVRASLCAVIVTYHPDDDFPRRVRRIADQVARVLIVDNHSGDETLVMMRDLCAGGGGEAGTPVQLIANAKNLGIAAALNQGARWAQEGGFGWMLTFDQDSFAFETLAANLAGAFSQEEAARRAAGLPGPGVAMAAANYRQTADGQPGYTPAPSSPSGGKGGVGEKGWMPATYVITSGCLLSLDAYTALGPFREDFFIDYVDIEYSFRARARGFLLIATRDCLMEHTVGAMTAHRFLRTWWVSNYPAWRWYYRTRNLTLTSRAFFRQEPHWVREAWINLLLTCTKILLFEADKAAKARNIGRGLWRGLRDRP